MAKTVKTQLMPAGRPIVFDFNVDGEPTDEVALAQELEEMFGKYAS